jgi:antitoxin FitA
VIRKLTQGIKAALRRRAGRVISKAGLAGDDVPMSVMLAADAGHDIDFEPEPLGLAARTPKL